ncbi:hypothetical protein [Dongia sedimenti]|uniref:Integral membrane protein n=1 Tax=Dongia sedimenti TaxID=3064282 RepID=A0ABU0YMP0_9PROT|nr:hypothetical protein [Rhodospirillaceae bacterium R-7]
MIVEPKRDILLGPLLRAGLRRSWAARDHFLRLAIIPLAVMLIILVPLQQVVVQMIIDAQANRIPEDGGPMPQIALLALGYAAALNVFAVNWLRQLTLGMSGAPGVGLSLSGRHLRFFLLIMATSFGSGILAVILMLVLSAFGGAGRWAALMASMLIWGALIVRISPSWIGIALDAPMRLGTAWRRTAGQGFKLLIALLAVEVPLLFVQQVVGGLFEATGFIQVAPLTFILITAVFQLVGTAVQLAILVTAFPHFLRETV